MVEKLETTPPTNPPEIKPTNVKNLYGVLVLRTFKRTLFSILLEIFFKRN